MHREYVRVCECVRHARCLPWDVSSWPGALIMMMDGRVSSGNQKGPQHTVIYTADMTSPIDWLKLIVCFLIYGINEEYNINGSSLTHCFQLIYKHVM